MTKNKYMAKRITKAEANLIVLLIIVGLPIYGVVKLGETVGWPVFLIISICLLSLCIYLSAHFRKKRFEELMRKYNDKEIVDLIMSRSFWQGQTTEQLLDSLGRPYDVDEKVMKTRKREVWKYQHRGHNRYGLRITLDNDIVVGWDQK